MLGTRVKKYIKQICIEAEIHFSNDVDKPVHIRSMLAPLADSDSSTVYTAMPSWPLPVTLIVGAIFRCCRKYCGIQRVDARI